MLNVVRKTGGNMHRFGISLTIESPSAWYMQSALDTVRLLENCTVFFSMFFLHCKLEPFETWWPPTSCWNLVFGLDS